MNVQLNAIWKILNICVSKAAQSSSHNFFFNFFFALFLVCRHCVPTYWAINFNCYCYRRYIFLFCLSQNSFKRDLMASNRCISKKIVVYTLVIRSELRYEQQTIISIFEKQFFLSNIDTCKYVSHDKSWRNEYSAYSPPN